MTSTTAQHSADSTDQPTDLTLPAPRSRAVAPRLELAWVIAAFGFRFAVASLLTG